MAVDPCRARPPPELTPLEKSLLAPTIDNFTNLRYQLSKKDCESFFKRPMEILYPFPPITISLNYTVLLNGQKDAMEGLLKDILMKPRNNPTAKSEPLLEACLALWSFKNIWSSQQTLGYFESILWNSRKIIQLLKLFSGKDVRLVDFFLAAAGGIKTKRWCNLEEDVQEKALAMVKPETINDKMRVYRKGSKKSRNRALHSKINYVLTFDESKFFEKFGGNVYLVQREPGSDNPLGPVVIDSNIQHLELYNQKKQLIVDLYGDFEGKLPSVLEQSEKKMKVEEMYMVTPRETDDSPTNEDENVTQKEAPGVLS